MISLPLQVPSFSQRDPGWAKVLVGFGTSTFGSVGCVLTSVTAVLRYKGITITPPDLNEHIKTENGFVSIGGSEKNLLVWDAVRRCFKDRIATTIFSNTYNDKIVKGLINDGNPVIIQCNATPIAGRGYHFFVAKGKSRIMDPWDGKDKPFGIYQPSGYRAYLFK